MDDGVDAIMLAGETAAGEYPVLAVQTLDAVLRDAESAAPDRVVPGDIGDRHDRALCDAAVTLAAAAEAAAIVAVTGSGTTARRIAALRPPLPVYGVTAGRRRPPASWRSTAAWYPWWCRPIGSRSDSSKPELARRGIVRAGDAVVIARVALGPRHGERELRRAPALLTRVVQKPASFVVV